jgi:hypothetical protein
MRSFVVSLFAFLLLVGVPAFLPAQYPAQQKQTQTKELIVYVTKTGNKYHTANCRFLAKSKIPMSLKDAKAKSYTPCSVCKPPQ